jgi:hypothetical protein
MNESTNFGRLLSRRLLSLCGKRRSVLAQAAVLRARAALCLVVVIGLVMGIGLSSARSAQAQGITGSIKGTVTDTTGAVIGGATVTIKNLDTNATQDVTSSEIGSYTVPQLAPGHYSVKAVKTGFKAFEDDGITLQIDQVALINPSLLVGSEDTTVEVTLLPPAIQTEDSSIGEVIDKAAIQQAPLNGRLSLVGLIALAPGVQGTGLQDQVATRGLSLAVGTGGRSSTYGGFGNTLDGVSNTEITIQRSEPEIPSLDAIAEFKVLTNGAPAEFNQPAQAVVVSASGSNKLHGELLEFNRSKGTGAKNYFGAGSPRPPYERNEYGGNLSGPIVIPHLFNGQNKAFFFAAFEGLKLTQGNSYNTEQPTQQMRNGDFSQLLDSGITPNADGAIGCSNGGTCVFDPATGKQFPGNIIPSQRVNTVDQQLLNLLFPKPTQAGLGVNTFEQFSLTRNVTRFSLHLDYNLDAKDQLRFTYLRAFYGPNPAYYADSLQGGNLKDGEHNTNFIVGWNHIFSPSLVMDTYGSFFHLPVYRTPHNVNTDFSAIVPELGPELIEGAPSINFTQGDIQGTGEGGSKDLEQDAQLHVSITKVLPKHTVKAGFSYLYGNHWNDSANEGSAPARGQYDFSGRYTSDPNGSAPAGELSGSDFADFFLGYPIDTINGDPNNYITRDVSSQYGLYIQDDWKPLPHLTINAGLRYELQWFNPGPYGLNSLYVPSLGKVVVFGKAYPSATIPGLFNLLQSNNQIELSSAAGLPSNPADFVGRNKKNFAPRLGFAYEIFPATVVRGAFGIYYNLVPSLYASEPYFANLPFQGVQTYLNSGASGATPSFSMYNPFSTTGSLGSNPSVNADSPTVTPYTEEYNLAVEHQFARSLSLRIGYVGQHNVKQTNPNDAGQNTGTGGTQPDLNLANPAVVGVSTQATALVQPFSHIYLNNAPIFHTDMNSLQVGVHKQAGHGLAFGAEYQWIRVIGTESIENPTGATPDDSRGPISGLAPQALALNYSYELPIGTRKLLFSNAGRLANDLVGGWQISGISSFRAGQPFSINCDPGSLQGEVCGRANVVTGVAFYPSKKTNAEWFNPAAFVAPSNYVSNGVTYDPYGTSGYDMLRGPRFQDWDMSLQKTVSLGERCHLLLRADSFNVFNHPSFGGPNNDISNTATAGSITSTASNYEPRTVEFGMKLSF